MELNWVEKRGNLYCNLGTRRYMIEKHERQFFSKALVNGVQYKSGPFDAQIDAIGAIDKLEKSVQNGDVKTILKKGRWKFKQ